MKHRTITLAILLLAFALRVVNIEAQSIWGDEAFSIYTAKQNIAYIVSGGTDVHPPLYHLLLHFWIQLAGDSPLAARFLSAMWSMLIVAAGYALAKAPTEDGRRRTKDLFAVLRRPSAVAFLLAISPFQIFYAQETRMYAQAAALCALSLLLFVRWQSDNEIANPVWRGTNGRKLPIAWFIATLLAIYTHYFSFFILAAQAIWGIWQQVAANRARPNMMPAKAGSPQPLSSGVLNVARAFIRRRSLTGWSLHLLLALLYLPWLVVQIGYLSSRANARVNTLSLQSVWDVISKTLGALFIGTTVDGSTQIVLALLFLALTLIGSLAVRHSQLANLLLLSILLPILGAIAFNPLLPYFRERFLLLSSMPFIVLMAYGITQLGNSKIRIAYYASRVLFPLIFFISLISLINDWHNPQYHKGEYDQAIAAIRANAQPNDAIIIYSPIQDALYDYYRIDGLVAHALPKADLNAISARHPRAWLILYGDAVVYDPNHTAEKFLSERGFKSFYQSYRDGALARYDFAHGDTVVENKRIKFGDSVLLTGYSLPSMVARGGTLPVTLQWQTSAPLSENYTVFAHLLGADGAGRVVAQMDTQPVGGTRPTKTWQVGETVRDNIGVAIPANVPVGRYQVEVGMYLLQTLKRLEIRDVEGLRVMNDAVIIGEVEIR